MTRTRTALFYDPATRSIRRQVVDIDGGDLPAGSSIKCPASACGAVAYVTTRGIYRGERIESAALAYPDGTPVAHGARIRCSSCGQRYRGMHTDGYLMGPMT